MELPTYTNAGGIRGTATAMADLASAPASSLKAVTPHASDELPDGIARALWINDEGAVDVAVVADADDDPVTLTITGPGPLPVRAKAVRVSGTTATSIVAVY